MKKSILAGFSLAIIMSATTPDPDEVQLRTKLAGGSIGGVVPSGEVEFRSRPSRGGERSFHVEIENVNVPAGTSLDVLINGQPVGKLTISVAPVRGGELELSSRDGDDTPTLKPGDVVSVRSSSNQVLSGAAQTRALDDVRKNPPAQTNSTSSSPASTTPVGETRARTNLSGGTVNGSTPSGHVDFRQRSSGDSSLTVEVEDLNLTPGSQVEVEVDGQTVGRITVNGAGRGGELELDSRHGNFVPTVKSGSMVVLRSPGRTALLSGVVQTNGATLTGTSSNSSASTTTDTRLRTSLAGGSISGVTPTGHIDFRDRGGNDARLNVEVEDVNVPAGSVLDVEVNGRVVGRITVNSSRSGELELNSRDGAVLAQIRAGATVVVRSPDRGAILSGVAQTRSIDEPVPSSSQQGGSAGSNGSNSGGSNSGGSDNGGDDKGRNGGSGNSGSGSGNSGSGSGNSGSGSGNSGSGSGNSGSGSGNSGSGSGNSGSGSSGGGSSSGGSNSGSGSGSGSRSSGSGSGGSGSGSGSGGSGNSGGGNSGGGKDDGSGHK
ncbi:MAG: hypothetical protein U0Q16_24465 [Bryobacteraceae bacterium]